MKKIIYIILFTSLITNAQNNLKIVYEYNDYGGYQKNLILKVKNNLAQFLYHKNDSTIVNDEGMEFYHFNERYENYYNLSTKKITEQRFIKKGNTTLTSEWDLNIKWKIADETKEINGYKAQKAVTKSYEIGGTSNINGYGNAIAWFTTEIPIGVGPQRYYGLPGLIVLLEFELVKNKYFLLKEIKYDEEILKIEIPTEGIKVSKDEILKPWTINKKWLRKQKKNISKKNN